MRRGQSVRGYMSQNGISESRMRVKPWGELRPAADNVTASGNDNAAGRARNRRVEFRITVEDPTRRLIFNSAKPGTLDQQEKNLLQNENSNDDDMEPDTESEVGRPGSRVNN